MHLLDKFTITVSKKLTNDSIMLGSMIYTAMNSFKTYVTKTVIRCICNNEEKVTLVVTYSTVLLHKFIQHT